MKLNKWFVSVPGSPYDSPELLASRKPVLGGIVSGNPKFEDGDPIFTSSIRGKRNGNIITASGSEYELGEVDPGYEAEFPGAKERLLSSLSEV